MPQPSIYKIYSNFPSQPQPVTKETPFSFHFAVFQALRTRKPKLLNQSYTAVPVRSVGGPSFPSIGPPMAAIIPLLCKQTSWFGEQSIWKITDNEANEITIFIEILDEGNTPMSSRCERFKTLVRQYADQVARDVSPVRDAAQQRESLHQEISDYTCAVFYNHWIKMDLENVADPRLGVHTPDARTAVARAFGSDVRLHLADFLDMVEKGVTT